MEEGAYEMEQKKEKKNCTLCHVTLRSGGTRKAKLGGHTKKETFFKRGFFSLKVRQSQFHSAMQKCSSDGECEGGGK